MQGGSTMSIKLKFIVEALKNEDLFLEYVNEKSKNDDIDSIYELVFNGKINTDSKKIQSGDLFVCIKGFSNDGHIYAPQAFENGATVLVVTDFLDLPVIQLKVSDSRKATAIIAKVLYDDPTSKFDLIGVTGTNGKTTSTFLLEQLFKKQYLLTQTPVFETIGVIGTLGYKIGEQFYPSERTTPDVVELNEIFMKMIDAGCKIVIMEVSSHALALYRVYGLHFKIGIFTNLSQDHLDFHKNMLEYGNAKLTLFEMVQSNDGYSIINIDDPFGHKIFKRIKSKKAGFSICPACQMPVKETNVEYWNISDIELSASNSKFSLFYKNYDYAIKFDNISIPLPGKFNIQNMASALIVLHNYIYNNEIKPNVNIDNKQEIIKILFNNFSLISQKLTDLISANGRMEKVNYKSDYKIPSVYIDYAHTPDALENILTAIREFTNNRIICVWGCGGNRDKSKRPQMAKISVKNAELTIITNDNPRLEFPEDIIRDITSNISWQESFYIIRDRSEAIKTAIMLAKDEDTVIIAGKGHETYQEIGTVKYHFDDKEEIMKALSFRETYYTHSNKKLSSRLVVPFDLLMVEKIFNIKIDNAFLQDNNVMFNLISTDSRQVINDMMPKDLLNVLFVALKGDNFDGSDYVFDILKQNEKNWCIVDIDKKSKLEKKFEKIVNEFHLKKQIIYVEDSLNAYGKLAQKYLQLFNLKKIALTGSTGKTTTKEILFNIFSEKFNTFKTFKNENNRIGVPKTIFQLDFFYDCVIFEIGTNQFGEINSLSEIIKPNLGIIVNVNPSHLEHLKSEELIMQEKMSLLNYVSENALIPSSKKFARFLKEFSSKSIYTFCVKNDDLNEIIDDDNCNFEKVIPFDEGYDDSMIYLMKNVSGRFEFKVLFNEKHHQNIVLRINNEDFYVNQKIPYYCVNTIVAICAAKLYNVEKEIIQSGLEKELKIENRMEIIDTDLGQIIFDCYNANPYSMKAALLYWAKLQDFETRIAIIGDMLELGEHSDIYHKEIGELIVKIKNNEIFNNQQKDIKTIIVGIGQSSKYYNPDYHFKNVNEFIKQLNLKSESNVFNELREKILHRKGLYLVKASHGLKLEKLKGLL
jgi:murE/murF fusion protein